MLVVHEYVIRIPRGSLWFRRRYTIIIDYETNPLVAKNIFKFCYGKLLFASDRDSVARERFVIQGPATLFICSRAEYFGRRGSLV